jgi:hypothetical protein
MDLMCIQAVALSHGRLLRSQKGYLKVADDIYWCYRISDFITCDILPPYAARAYLNAHQHIVVRRH